MSQAVDRRAEDASNDRRRVKRFSDPELRATARQIQSLLKVIMVTMVIVIGDQAYLASLDKRYMTRAFFYVVVALMALVQTFNYHGSLTKYCRGESASSMVNSFVSQRNFFVMMTFLVALFTIIYLVGQMH